MTFLPSFQNDETRTREATLQTLAMATLSIPTGVLVTTGVCWVALGWAGDGHQDAHRTAVLMQGA